MAAQTPTATPTIPFIHLLCLQTSASDAFTTTLTKQKINHTLNYTVHNSSLAELDPAITFDLVVSPANSYGILDGGFDHAISRAWSPQSDYVALTRHVQAELYDVYRGYLPPGGCHITKIPEEFRGRLRYTDSMGWGCRFLALCPTMRVPGSCTWDREVVYECIWSLMGAIERLNRGLEDDQKVKSILMTPLGTGTGGVSDKKWAQQTVLAIKHYVEASENAEKWKQLNWPDVGRIEAVLERTHGM